MKVYGTMEPNLEVLIIMAGGTVSLPRSGAETQGMIYLMIISY